MTDVLMDDALSTLPGGEDVGQYLAEIRRYPMLTQEQERALARRCAAGDEEALRLMVSSNLRLVVHEAWDYAGRGVPLPDLIQEGSIGLIHAAKKFDYTRDLRFSTYATKWIRQRIGRFLSDQSAQIRVPAYTAGRMRRLQRENARLRQTLGREPTLQELADASELETDKAAELLSLTPELCSLDAPAGDDATVGELLPGSDEMELWDELLRRELKELLEGLMDELNERQRTILRLHFGMDDGVCRSLEEISKELRISKERVRQIERQALEKLQKIGTRLGLEDFLE